MKSAKKASTSNTNLNKSISPVGKKLIQARLPFKSVAAPATPTAATAAATPSSTAAETSLSTPQKPTSAEDLPRKRKLSDISPSPRGGRKAKLNRTTSATPVGSPLPAAANADTSSSSAVADANQRVESKENLAEPLLLSSDNEDDVQPAPKSTTPWTPKPAKSAEPAAANRSARKTPARKTPKSQSAKKLAAQAGRKRKASNSPNKLATAVTTGSDDVIVLLDDDSCLSVVSKEESETPAVFAIRLPVNKKRIVAADSPVRSSPRKPKTPVKTPTTTKTPTAKAEPPAASTPVSKTPTKSPAKVAKSASTATPTAVTKTPTKSPAKTPGKSPAKVTVAESPSRRSRRSLTAVKSADKSSDDDAELLNSSAKPQESEEEQESSAEDELNAPALSGEKEKGPSATEKSSAAVDTKAPSHAGLTPKQLARRLQKEKRERAINEEKEQRRLERQKERDEREAERKRERDAKDEQKRCKEDERKRRDEQKEEERRKKEEQREEERRKKEEQRDEERRKKEEQRDEERRKKEDERVAKEEAEKKKKEKSLAAFSKFFAARKDPPTPAAASATSAAGQALGEASNDASDAAAAAAATQPRQNFMPFRCKEDMRLAPLVRRVFSAGNREAFDGLVLRDDGGEADRSALYLGQLREAAVPRGRMGKTWITSAESEVQIIEDELEGASAVIEQPSAKQTFRAKFFKFTENRRPPFYGTWRRRSTAITARKPFVQDAAHFDYECDSDDEWEEEEPGESLHGSDDERDKDAESADDDEYDIDNKFFVPHGHLSDEEVDAGDDVDDDEEEEEDDDDNNDGSGKRATGGAASLEMDDNSPAAQKAKLKIIQMQFAHEMKKKTEKIKPRLVGCVWQRPNGGAPETCATIIWDMLRARAAQFEGASVRVRRTVDEPKAEAEEGGSACGGGGGGSAEGGSQRAVLSDDDIADLCRLMHGNRIKRQFLIHEFHAYLGQKYAANAAYQTVAKARISRLQKELCSYRACPDADSDMRGSFCWYVPLAVREKYGALERARLPNDWKYVLKVPVQAGRGSTPAATATAEHADGASNDGQQQQQQQQQQQPASQEETALPTKKAASKFSISQFARVLSDEEKRKQFESVTLGVDRGQENVPSTGAAVAASTDSANEPVTKKRINLTPVVRLTPLSKATEASYTTSSQVTRMPAAPVAPVAVPVAARKRVSLLASVPLNQELPVETKRALISNFLSKTTKAASNVAEQDQGKAEVGAEKATVVAVETIEID